MAANMKMMFNLQMVQMLVEMEPAEVKKKIIIGASVFGLAAVVIDGFYWARVDSIVNGQSRYEDSPGADDSLVAYDIGCGAPWSDDADAAEILKDFGPDCDSDCQKKGSEWSTAFFANAVIIMLIVFNMICACIGTKKAIARVIASCCACLICCAHFGIIITTAVFRFRPQGQLCALSLRPTSIPADKDSEITDDWT